MSDEPMTPLLMGAAALHENMLAYVQAGFTRDEALKIVIAMLTEAMRRGNGEAGGGGGGA